MPPPELEEYHTANLSSWTSLRDAAQQRPSGDSYLGDYLNFLTELNNDLLPVALDATLTEEDKVRLSDEILVARVRDFFGQDTYTTGRAAQQVFETLHQEEREILGLHDCTPPLLFLDTKAETGSNEVDRTALMALYIATDGPSWNQSTNWATDAPIGEWYGVVTDAGGRVKYLDLSSNRMNGEIAPELGNLASLRRLDLGMNQLRGPIPPELGNLTYLEVLDLSDNTLVGEIPLELVDINSLVNLNVSANQLTGEIPAEIGNLANLVVLNLASNALSGGIPPELGKLGKLGLLSLGGNNLSGQIPPEIGDLSELVSLLLTRNQLSGDVTPTIGEP